jgi:hypothetical protein
MASRGRGREEEAKWVKEKARIEKGKKREGRTTRQN